MKNKNDIDAIEKKLRKILSFEFHKKNYFPQRISDIKDYLVAELYEIAALEEAAQTLE